MSHTQTLTIPLLPAIALDASLAFWQAQWQALPLAAADHLLLAEETTLLEERLRNEA